MSDSRPRRSPLLPFLAALLLSCTGLSPAEQAEAYSRAVAVAATEPQVAATLCRKTGEAEGECLAMAASATASDLDHSMALCGEIEDEVWREECAFLVAEVMVESRGGHEAAATCAQAGRFAKRCVTHGWRLYARDLLREEEDMAVVAARFAAARPWADGILDPGRRRDSRMWYAFSMAAMGERGLDAAWCASFPLEHRSMCEEELPAALRLALNASAHEASNRGEALDPQVLCGPGELHQRIEATTGLRYVPSEALDAVAERFVASPCRGR